MSVQSTVRRKTAPEIRARKGGEPIVMLTSYHAHTAALVDRHCDVILVGDSLGNVMHGFETTVPVTLGLLGLSPRAPKFVRRYGNLGPAIDEAVERYAADVRTRAFPAAEHVYGMKSKT